MPCSIEISVGDVNDVEAHIVARYIGAEKGGACAEDGKPVSLRGMLRGPYCAHAHTLPAEFHFRESSSCQTGVAEAIIPDPCLWSPELPQLYQVVVKAFRGDQLVAEYDRKLGLKRATPRRSGIEFPG
jgi:hypothetical protein